MNSIKTRILAIAAVTVLTVSVFAGCSDSGNSTSDTNGNSSTVSINTDVSKIVVPSDVGSNTGSEISSRDSLTDSENAYLSKLFACMPGANFTSKYELDDQICLQYIETILRYQDATGDIFFVKPDTDSAGNYTLDKQTVETICKELFNFTPEHTSDYLVGDKYLFPASSPSAPPTIEFTKTSLVGTIFQIDYTLTYNGREPEKHIASVYRTTNLQLPFRIHSITTNS